MGKTERGNRSESVFKQFSAALKGFIVKHSSSTLLEAEDMLHDVFYKFMVADGEEQLIQNVSSWLYRVTRNQIIDSSRKKQEERMPLVFQDRGGERMEISLSELLSNDDNNYHTDPESELFRRMIREELESALEELPCEQRAIFELNEIQGVSFSEIAQSTGVPINTLISRKRYATQHLRQHLASIYKDSLSR
ncbi:MAG: sigma-70 family RNA polymerase sigma factor [Rikenellaceae bacterium]